ncbi:hypothetical protein SAMN05444141_101381 [Pseudovibrio denitrificans]|uniref:Uncharacterized protein n=1 Tax=Pseudovibrio denitrificans TaxID=258256 RepID=A0A1I6XR07_9HYPH|nr:MULTISPECIES: hypothetical protein [Pseudovibrio]EEA96342.1 putative secreted protein [Pseudovibrio sp. JE062]SFT40818.1 hypothetical protein SAMN05444141_101381 [Pseudovibrio denitrificans]
MENSVTNTTLLLNSYKELLEKRPLELGDEATPLVEDNKSSIEVVDTLADAELLSDAVKVLAHALSKPRAVWWASQVSRASFPEGTVPTDDEEIALKAAEDWVRKPEEDLRRAAMKIADDGGYKTAACLAAAAAGWSGGSMGSPEFDPAPPPENLTSIAVGSSIVLSVYDSNVEDPKEFLVKAFKLGRALADNEIEAL